MLRKCITRHTGVSMEELRFHFSELQFLTFCAWVALVFMMLPKRRLFSGLGLTCLFSVTFMVGYLCLISFGILGAGFSPGLIFPGYDAYIEHFLLFFFGVPIVILAILILYALEIRRDRRFQPTSTIYAAVSIYLLWSTLTAHVNVISGI